ncbi:MAG: HAMP domain-containing sensor histidine kinase [Acidimicrobiales bacterium]
MSAFAVIGFGLPLGFVIERFIEEDATVSLERAAVLASRDVSLDFATSDDPVELPVDDQGTEFGLYDTAGVLVAGVGPALADDAVRGALTNAVVDAEVDGRLVAAVPVAADEHVVGVIRAARPASLSDDRTLKMLLLIFGLGVGVVAVSASIGWVLAGRLSRPVGRLRDAARDLGQGDFAISVPSSAIPELDEAAAALNATAGYLGSLVERERAFSSDASHQLRTPLAGMRAAIETELAFPRDSRNDVLDELLADIDRMETTVVELLTIARSTEAVAPVDVSVVLGDLESAWSKRTRRLGRGLAVGHARFVPTPLANAAMLRHALDVLVDNALVHGSGTVAVDAIAVNESIRITVRDDGHGFDASVDLETAGSTHGLGLPLARRLVEAMGGRLVLPTDTAGSAVEIVLRRADTTSSR